MKLDVEGQGGKRILDIDGQGGGGLENWSIFMDVICVSSLMASYKKAAGRLHLLNKSRFQLDTKIAVTIYKSLIIPVLAYYTILSIFDNKSRAARLSSIDSRATRIANIQADQAHAVTLTPTASMKMKHACMFARKCIDGKLFEKFAEYFSLMSHKNLPSVETEFSKRSVYFSRAKLYNELPVQIRQLDSFEIFPVSKYIFLLRQKSLNHRISNNLQH